MALTFWAAALVWGQLQLVVNGVQGWPLLNLAEGLLQGLAPRVPTFLDSGVLHGWEGACAHVNACVRAQECMCVNACNAKL